MAIQLFLVQVCQTILPFKMALTMVRYTNSWSCIWFTSIQNTLTLKEIWTVDMQQMLMVWLFSVLCSRSIQQTSLDWKISLLEFSLLSPIVQAESEASQDTQRILIFNWLHFYNL